MCYRIPYYSKIFFQNPLIFFQKALGRILIKSIRPPEGVVQISIGGHYIDVFPSRNNWWKSMYLGYCDVEIAHSIKKYLTPGGIFIDAGAGIGYFSAIASDIIGTSGQVHCFEPNPNNAGAIRKMIESNSNSNIILNDSALGADDGVQNYYIQHFSNSTANSMIDTFLENVDEVRNVRTRRLDNYLEQKNIGTVSLIKIDVEGYEYYVLRGLAGFFEKTNCRPPIICEIGVPAYKKAGLSLSDFNACMKDYGYQAYNIINHKKRVDILSLSEVTDVIFMPMRRP